MYKLTIGTSFPAGQDATDAFFSLHRHEVLLRPGNARLQIGVIAGENEAVKALAPGETSRVPYAEPTWLSPGFYSPYYTDSHRKFQAAVRKFSMEVMYPDALAREVDGKRISDSVLEGMRFETWNVGH